MAKAQAILVVVAALATSASAFAPQQAAPRTVR